MSNDKKFQRQPIEDKHRQQMNEIAGVLASALPPGTGFALLVFDLGATHGRMNYISNAERADMLVAMKAFVAADEGRTPPSTNTQQ